MTAAKKKITSVALSRLTPGPDGPRGRGRMGGRGPLLQPTRGPTPAGGGGRPGPPIRSDPVRIRRPIPAGDGALSHDGEPPERSALWSARPTSSPESP